MSFLSSLKRFMGSLFGQAEGRTERATDSLVSSSPDAIRAQFRKTREDWAREYSQMREAVADLIRIREMRLEEVKRLTGESDDLEQKMTGAIELYKKNPDERYRDAYAQLASKNTETEARIKELMTDIDEQQKGIERYKLRLTEFQRQIESLGREEAETVADIVSSQKVRELNDRLSGLSVDTQSKNLEAIRAARQKAKAVAKLSNELSGTEKTDLDAALKTAGAGAKYFDAFDAAVSGKPKVTATEVPSTALPSAAKDDVARDIDRLLKGSVSR